MRKVPVPDGAKLYVASTFNAAMAAGVATNAVNAVVTVTGHSVVAGKLVLIDSDDWPELAGKVARVTVAADKITLQGIDTTSTDKYPAGGKLTLTLLPTDADFTRLPYVTSLGLSGGELKTGTSEYLDVEADGEYATGRSPRRMEYSVSFNADGAGRAALLGADGKFTVHKLVYKNGDATYYAGELHYNDTPSTEKGQEQTTTSTVLLQNAPSFVKKAA